MKIKIHSDDGKKFTLYFPAAFFCNRLTAEILYAGLFRKNSSMLLSSKDISVMFSALRRSAKEHKGIRLLEAYSNGNYVEIML